MTIIADLLLLCGRCRSRNYQFPPSQLLSRVSFSLFFSPAAALTHQSQGYMKQKKENPMTEVPTCTYYQVELVLKAKVVIIKNSY